MLDKLCDRLLKGKISWKWVVALAIICGTVTGVIMNFQDYLENASIVNIGICFEFWILMAVIILSKCEKPYGAAAKVFVFFLISQPLVYLVQVPFNEKGWGLFQYYGGWFRWTLLTFPGAFIGWYIKKRNWLSAAVFFVAILGLCGEFGNHFWMFIRHMPLQLLALLFILAQMFLYIYSFPDKKKRIVLTSLTVVAMAVFLYLFYLNSMKQPVYYDSTNVEYDAFSCEQASKRGMLEVEEQE